MKALENAYAKINLFLDVTGKRADGFHDIKSIMQTVSLADMIELEAKPNEKIDVSLSLTISPELSMLGLTPNSLGAPEDNLACRAARLYLERASISAGVVIRLEKRIPVAAGLGGGSADAAAVLRALNGIYSAFTQSELLDISLEIGSDVPFCLVCGTALCSGRGEKMVNLSYTPDLNVVIAIGKSKISTVKAYKALDDAFSDFDGTAGDPREFSSLSDGIENSVYNIFEYSRLPELKEVEHIKELLRTLGATATLMSGSGPSVFGIFGTKNEADSASKSLRENGIFAVSTKTVRI